MYKTNTQWHIPAYVKDPLEPSTYEDGEVHYNLIVFNNCVSSEDPLFPVGIDYIPVYEDIRECHKVVEKLTSEHKDESFVTCIFDNLTHVEMRVKDEFKDKPVRIVIKERKG